MGVQLDLIIPPIIVGMLIIIIFRVNAFVMETSIDNRLNNDMQNFAEVTAVVIEDQLRSVNFIVGFDTSRVRYVNFDQDTITIQRNKKNLEVISADLSGTVDTLIYPSSMSDLHFKMEPDTVASPMFIRFKVETESNPEDHMQMRKEVTEVRGFAERRVFLRNVAVRLNSTSSP